MLIIQAHYALAKTYYVFVLLSYLQDQLNTEPMYLVIALFSTERLYINITIRYVVLVSLGDIYLLLLLQPNPFRGMGAWQKTMEPQKPGTSRGLYQRS